MEYKTQLNKIRFSNPTPLNSVNTCLICGSHFKTLKTPHSWTIYTKRNVYQKQGPVFLPVYGTQPATGVFFLWLRLGSAISRTVWCSVSRLGKIKAVQEGVKTFVNTFTAYKTFIQRLVRPSVRVRVSGCCCYVDTNSNWQRR